MRLAVLAVAFLLAVTGSTGCSSITGAPPAKPKTAPSGGAQVQLPENTVFEAGAKPSPSPAPNGSSIRSPLAQLPPLPSASGMYRTSSPNPSPGMCGGYFRQGVRNGLTVVPATTSAIVTWWNLGDPALRSYELAAVSQELVFGIQPPWKWQTVAKGTGCSQITTTFTGLSSGKPYVFVLHAVLRTYENVPAFVPEIARSSPIVML
jgi:hypothetical protein